MKITAIYTNGIKYVSKKPVDVNDDFNINIDMNFSKEPPLHILFPTLVWDNKIKDTKYVEHKFTRK